MVSIAEHLNILAKDPLDVTARRQISRAARGRVGSALWALDLAKRPDLGRITEEILNEAGSDLSSTTRRAVLPTVRSIVEGVFDDDEPTGVTEVLTEWGETGHVNEENLYGALQVALGKRIRWILGSRDFNSLRHKVSPGDLMNELFLKLQKSGVPKLLENRIAFFRYSEAVLRNRLIDMQRADLRDKRPPSRNKEPLEDFLRILEERGGDGSRVSLPREAWIDLTDAVETLPTDLKAVIRHHYIWGWEIAESAQALGVSESTIKRRLREALVVLREKLIQGGYEPPSREGAA